MTGNYEPENCKWIPLREQALNRRNTLQAVYRDEKKPLIEWCRELDLNYPTVYSRIKYRGWSVDKALTTPTHKEAV